MIPSDSVGLQRWALAAQQQGDEAEAAPVLAAAAARFRTDPLLWQWSALLHRALDRNAEALAAAETAARLAPGHPRIAQGLAHIRLEAGKDAVSAFEAAARLEPANGEILLGLAAARLAVGEGARAVADLDALLAANPLWVDGHSRLAQLRCVTGNAGAATASFERALAAFPRDFSLWQGLIATLVQGERWEDAGDAIARARKAMGDGLYFDANEAVVRSERGEVAAADALFAKVAQAQDPTLEVRRVRHLLRNGRIEAALERIERALQGESAGLIWPYAALGWRIAGDPRWQWLEGDERLVSVIDLADKLPPLNRLAEVLRGLHHAQGEYLDQSVRGGTQTDGPLFARIEPEIAAVRAAIVAAVEGHITRLPPPDPRHPTLGPRHDRPVRFSGSWSVRLADAGHHSNHIHPLGWFSSALYVSLPEPEGQQGWLKLGEPREDLGLGLEPFRTIEPKAGRLVLFPSTMWHGTIPFAAGERLTIAFDVAPPR
ncbi:putative 2OG-Fe(II) oxygenase [Sphingomonas sp. LB-2]|uniref:2OG-Fe(II) oxygenase family protein n=1 Tax=Sphingomonas caeni TaxID=2984949 RepID=UPI00222E8A27|nr:putative 2OG-Fe(II) oxygenase [Sphingomonas caeni]MCW3846270.1 putative 2OG-Fe(II) oxygenase [Sphingomonas caeni]